MDRVRTGPSACKGRLVVPPHVGCHATSFPASRNGIVKVETIVATAQLGDGADVVAPAVDDGGKLANDAFEHVPGLFRAG
jgi:hypothetical protein